MGDGITWSARYKIRVVMRAGAGIQAGVPAWRGLWGRVIPAEAGIQPVLPASAAWPRFILPRTS